MGRGDFANRTWQFVSRNPLDYQIADAAVPVIPNSLAAQILKTLNRKKGICARTIAAHLNKSVSTIRNELTALRNHGLVIAEKLGYVNYYKLARAKK
jgi:DNA-binding transcriptional ArsR family regulator